MLSVPCPIWWPLSLHYLWQGQHSRACGIQQIHGEHRWQLLDQAVEEPKRRGALLDLILSGMEGLVGTAKVKGASGHVQDANVSLFIYLSSGVFGLVAAVPGPSPEVPGPASTVVFLELSARIIVSSAGALESDPTSSGGAGTKMESDSGEGLTDGLRRR